MVTRKHYIRLATFLTGLVVLATVIPTPAISWLYLAYILGAGWLVGEHHWTDREPVERLIYGMVAFSAVLATGGAVTYRLYELNWLGCLLTWLGALAFFWIWPAQPSTSPAPWRWHWQDWTHLISWLPVVVLLTAAVRTLTLASTDLSLRTPWSVVPNYFFVCLAFAALGTIAVTAHDTWQKGAAWLWSAWAVVATSVAAIVYRIGYGFDPFIHQATEQAIVTNGEVLPKPFYYLGQYAWTVLASRATHIAPATLERFLVPGALAIAIVVIYHLSCRIWPNAKQHMTLSLGALLLLPLGSMVSATPQALANILAITAAFAIIAAANNRERWLLPTVLVTTTALVHPLAGLPIATGLAVMWLRSHRIRPILIGITAVLGSLALPLAFLANTWLAGHDMTQVVGSSDGGAMAAFVWPDLTINRHQAALDFAYAFRLLRWPLLLVTSLGGLWHWSKKTPLVRSWFIIIVVCLMDGLALLTVVDFPMLIAYERADYARRLFELAVLLAAPGLLYAAYHLTGYWKTADRRLRLGGLLLLAATLTANVYLAYPRNDDYDTSRGWSTSAADVAAVQAIAARAAGRPYAVLANQAVSAAAIRELGFAHQISLRTAAGTAPAFIYPIPTGDQLYQDFLAVTEARGARAAIDDVFDTTDTDIIYLVINRYWWHSGNIIATAKTAADEWWRHDDAVYVFEYLRVAGDQVTR